MVSKGKAACCGVSGGLLLIGLGLIAAGLSVILSVVPKQVKDTINKQKVLIKYSNGTYNDFTKDWAKPPYISTMQYWVYDYKNVLGVLNRGMLPDMDEKGPYGYREDTFNNITWMNDDNTQLRYVQQKNLVFDPARSCAGCDPTKDKVMIPDVSFLVLVGQLHSFDAFCGFLGSIDPNMTATVCGGAIGGLLKPLYDGTIVPMIGDALDVFETAPFVEVTVEQMLFSGYNSPFISHFLKNLLPLVKTIIRMIPLLDFLLDAIPTNIPNFPISFVGAYYTNSFDYLILTGKDGYKAGNLLSFKGNGNGEDSRGNMLPEDWWNPNCSDASKAYKIRGNTGDYYPSFLKKKDRVPIFVSDVCRTINMAYEQERTIDGIPTWRFILPTDSFDYTKPENCGFCHKLQNGFYDRNAGEECLPNGLLDISGCKSGMPIAISKPHFYQAEQIVQQFVPRFKPAYENDEVTMDVEPQSGTIIEAQKRLQINVMWSQFNTINSLKLMRPGAYPMFWLNESYFADEGTKNDLKSALINQVKTYKIICYSAVGVGGLLIVLSLVIDVILAFCKRKSD